MKRIMVRYTVKADKADDNAALIRDVFEELRRTAPEGLRYASFVEPDGVSFVHIASIETEDGSNPLGQSAAFQRFQADIKERCEVPPQATPLSEIGSYRLPD